MRKLLIILLLSLPFSAHAVSTHHYVCSDMSLSVGVTCTDSPFKETFPGVATQYFGDYTSQVFNLVGKTWYVSYTTTGSFSGVEMYCASSSNGGGECPHV